MGLKLPSAQAITGVGPVSVKAAPWQALLTLRADGRDLIECGGTVIGPRHVVTAAHCVALSARSVRPRSRLAVHVGIGSFFERGRLSSWQRVAVARIRVHPWFNSRLRGESPFAELRDDVAVLELARPLQLDGRTAVAAVLPQPGTFRPPGGQRLQVSGFGEQVEAGRLDGRLRRLSVRVGRLAQDERRYDALWISGRSRSGALCGGDSGSGLVAHGAGTAAQILAIVSLSGGCYRGRPAFSIDLTAAEAGEFVRAVLAGENVARRLHRAPIGGSRTAIVATTGNRAPRVGSIVGCRAGGDWIGRPRFDFGFVAIDRQGNRRLRQRGTSASYAVTAADRGRRIGCRVTATTAGGRTTTTPVMLAGRVV